MARGASGSMDKHAGGGLGDACSGPDCGPTSVGNLGDLSDPSFSLLIYNEWLC